MALTDVPSNAPLAGWRSWAICLVDGAPRLLSHNMHALIGLPLVPVGRGHQWPIPEGRTPLEPYPDFGGYAWVPGVNEALPPTSEHWPWESAFYSVPTPYYVSNGQGVEAGGPREFGRATGAYGRVEAWGWTAMQGWVRTSQFARALEIFVAPHHEDLVDALAGYYGVPVSVG